MTGPGQKDTHGKWERQDEPQSDAPATKDGEGEKLVFERRWTVQEGPFRGFNSPPGRF